MVVNPGHVVHILIHRVTTTIITTADDDDVAALTYLFNLSIQLIYLAYLYICIYMFYVVRACCYVFNLQMFLNNFFINATSTFYISIGVLVYFSK